jgi:hypothetical protein
MQSFKITQKILAIGGTYEVRQSDSDEICYLVKGKIFSFKPVLEMRQGIDGSVTHSLKGNLWKTEFTVTDSSEMEVGSIKYPLIAFFQRFTLVTEGKVLNAKGGVTAWKFICTDENGNTMLEIYKDFAFRDRFKVEADESIRKEVAILTAISVDQRFFQNQ